MRLRYWTALLVVVSVSATIAMRVGDRPAPEIAMPAVVPTSPESAAPEDTSAEEPDAAELTEPEDTAPPEELVTWSRAIGPGESLDVLLSEAGLAPPVRADISRAIGTEYDLRRLQPGYRLSLKLAADGAPRRAELEVEDGLRVLAVFGATPSVRTVPPELETFVRAGEAEIGTSIYMALDGAGIPTRFATDLELVFDGALDLRRAVTGGEHLRIVWREKRLGERVIGDPIIDFAELVLSDARYEVIWPDDKGNTIWFYKDSQLERVFRQPVPGARLSSSFGLRDHPVHGGVRMHSGVDFSAEMGAPVYATQSGTIAYIGRRSGYGLMVEIEHPGNLRTFYAHLSATNQTLEAGDEIAAGQEIGNVGSTGTSTAPHLHYEIHVDGRPVAPLTDARLWARGSDAAATPTPGPLLETARHHLERQLERGGSGTPQSDS